MRIPAALCLLATSLPLLAQEDAQPPKATPVDPALQADPGEDWYQHGRNLYEAAKSNPDIDARLAGYTNSIDVFNRYLAAYPKNPNAEGAWWYMGQAYYGSGRIEEAKMCFQRLLNQFGKGKYAAAAAYTLAADHFNNRQYALAANLFEKLAQIATRAEERQRGNYYAGVCYDLQGRTKEASAFFQKVLDDPEPGNPFKTKAQFSLGRILARGDKLDEALALLDQVVNSVTTADIRGDAAVQAGTIAAKLGKVDESDHYFTLVMNTPGMEAARADAQLSLMAARFQQKRYQDVIDLFRKSDVKAEGDKEANRLMIAAKSFMMLGNNVDALEVFRQVERMGLPNDSYAFEANYLRLLCFFKIEGRHVPEQVDAFLELYKRGHSKDPRIHTALLMKAESLLANRQTAEAAKVYAEIDPALVDAANRADFLYNRGYCASQTSDSQGVVRSLTQFIDGFPGDGKVPKALIMRAKAYSDTGEFMKALADYDRLIARKDEPALRSAAWLLSADISKQRNELGDMVSRYREFLEKADKPSDEQKAKANYWLAWGLVKQSKSAEAVPYADAARKLDPGRYAKNAGQLLCLTLWSLQQPEKLGDELDEAIKGDYATGLPDQLFRWAALQAFNAGRFTQSARFYGQIVDTTDPLVTPKEDWRYYGKALLESKQPKEALVAINHALDAESQPQWKADGLLDRSRALFDLGKYDEATQNIDAGLALSVQGRVGFGLKILQGDICMKKGDPRGAAAAYASPVENMDDSDRVGKPAVVQKMIKALEEIKDDQLADREQMLQRYRKMMEKFPDWKPAG